MTGVQNLGHRDKGHINERNRKARKRKKEADTFKLWAHSGDRGTAPNACNIFSPMFPAQKCGPETQENIWSWKCRSALRK